ncbi:MAG TPA: MdtA/MuxA family multidrug efflux RND transporter periplasmic adaptor subunit [Bryobacteraceae bacterium]|jgi:multidrug efflux system membrane fusion protein|nr:MdtA/MuxA family multidrug efflux RND transporter periplasmic adaptor subunit [Bryobacteraceae bacterium]
MKNQMPAITAPEEPQALLPPPPGTAPPKAEPPKKDTPPTRRRKRWIYAVVLIAVALAALYFFSRSGGSSAGQKTGKGRGGRAGAPAVTPVVAVQAVKGNIGVYVSGLGAITPIYTVTVKSRVDGELTTIHYKEGDFVRQGDPLIEIDPRPYEAVVIQASGQLTRDQALLANARVDLARYTTLVAQDAVPEQTLATQRALVTQYEGTVTNDQGTLDAAKLNVTYSHIRAPITGIIGLRLVDPGNIVHAADTNGMLVITQIQPISVIFTVGEDQLPPILQKIRAGQTLQVEAWDREQKNKLATGSLETVDNQIDQTTGTLKLRAIFQNGNRALFPNQFVNARLLQQEKTGVVLLPSAAIQRNTNNTYVFLIKPDSTVTVRNITVGTTDGDESEITSGLNPGDKVVMTGVDKLEEGSKVAATMNDGK